MITGHGTRGVWAWVLGAVAALGFAALAPVVDSASVPILRPPSPPSGVVRRPYAADSLARLTVARDLFRLARRPASIVFDPQPAATPVETYQAPKPSLFLVGLVSGPEPTAVIDGLPGVEGSRVVRAGDQVSGIRVAAIARDHVRLVGMDTVWVLRVREPWRP